MGTGWQEALTSDSVYRHWQAENRDVSLPLAVQMRQDHAHGWVEWNGGGLAA